MRSYREHMADYASMRALEVWYDRIDIERLLKEVPSEEARERVEQRLEKARSRTVPEHDYPKLVEHHGATPRIKDNPPLIFHPTAELAPGINAGYRDAIGATASHCPSMSACCSTAFIFATWRLRRSESAASARCAPSDSSLRRTTTRFSCR